MSTATTKILYTPEDLLAMPDGDRYELVDGNLVELHMSVWSSYLAGRMLILLASVCNPNRLGWLFPEGTSYQCFPNHPKKVRKPDVSFIRLDRLTAEQAAAEGHESLTPDLAVEVVSPNDTYYEVDEKVDEWLEAGVLLVWVINPKTRTVRIRRRDGTEATLTEDDELSGEDVVPGFRCRVSEIFLPPAAVTPA